MANDTLIRPTTPMAPQSPVQLPVTPPVALTLVAVTPQPSRPAPTAQQRVQQFNRSIDSAPLMLPKPGVRTVAPVLPQPLSKVLGVGTANAPTWQGVPVGVTLNNRVVLAEIGRFLRGSGLAEGLPATWTPQQRDRFASLLVLSAAAAQKGAPGQSVDARLRELRENLQAAVELVSRPTTRLPDLADSSLDSSVDTRPLTPLPATPGDGGAAANAAQTLNQRIVSGDIGTQLASLDGRASRAAYVEAFAQIRTLRPQDQRSVAANLDRVYLGYVGQRAAAAGKAEQQALFRTVSGQLQALSADQAARLYPEAQALVAASGDLASVSAAQEIFRNDTNQPPILSKLVLPLSTGQISVDRSTIANVRTQVEQRLATAQTAWTTGIGNVAATTPTTPVAPVTQPGAQPEAPKPAAEWKKAASRVSIALGSNINPYLRGVLADGKSGAIRIKPFDSAADRAAVQGVVQNILAGKGQAPAAEAAAAAKDLIVVAERLNLDPERLANELTKRIAEGRALVKAADPQRPVLIDSRDPASVEAGRKYFTALLAEGIRVPPRTVVIDGKQVSLAAALKLTDVTTDLDGVLAASYGQFGLEVAVTTKAGRKAELYLPLGKSLAGVPTEIRGLRLKPGSQSAEVEVLVRDNRTNTTKTQRVAVALTQEQAKLLLDAREATVDPVGGLTARFFPASSMQLLVAVSNRNGKGVVFPGGVNGNEVVGNTFGTGGLVADAKVPGELARSLGRSYKDITLLPVQPGMPGVPNVTFYSGGAQITNADGQRLFGLTAEDAKAITGVARELDGMVDQLSAKYGLTNQQKADWKKLNFVNADIPSIILPGSVIDALKSNGTLGNLQRDIEANVRSLIDRNNLQDKYKIHHTPSQGNDELAVYNPSRPDAEFTTEWQVNVKGGKALPVLDALATQLKRDYGVDLLGDLKAAGYDFDRIRRMELPEVIAFMKDVARPIIDGYEQRLGSKVTPRMVVQADTYFQRADGKRGGSDMSMIDAVRALYGDENVTIVQVNTFGRNAPEPGRNPYFDMPIDPQTGKPTLRSPSVQPGTPGAPGVYVTMPDDLGKVLGDAYQNQLPLDDSELQTAQPPKKTQP